MLITPQLTGFKQKKKKENLFFKNLLSPSRARGRWCRHARPSPPVIASLPCGPPSMCVWDAACPSPRPGSLCLCLHLQNWPFHLSLGMHSGTPDLPESVTCVRGSGAARDHLAIPVNQTWQSYKTAALTWNPGHTDSGRTHTVLLTAGKV